MGEDGWRTRIRWVVVHPHDPKALRLGAPGAPAPGAAWVGHADLATAASWNEHAAVAVGVLDERLDGPLRAGRQPWASPVGGLR